MFPISAFRAALLLPVLILAVLALGCLLVKRGWAARDTLARALISLLIFAVIFYGAPLLTQQPAYDAAVETLKLLAAVTGAGCYWIGSRP